MRRKKKDSWIQPPKVFIILGLFILIGLSATGISQCDCNAEKELERIVSKHAKVEMKCNKLAILKQRMKETNKTCYTFYRISGCDKIAYFVCQHSDNLSCSNGTIYGCLKINKKLVYKPTF